MADLTITAANVDPDVGYQFVDGEAGETLTAGQAVYLKAADGLYWKADADVDAATATVIGITLNGASANQPVRIQTGGTLDLGATLTTGEIYVLSGTAGGIAPEADLASSDFVSLIGVGLGAASLGLRIYNSGVQVP